MSFRRPWQWVAIGAVLLGVAIYFGSLWLYEWSVAPPPQGHVDRLTTEATHSHPDQRYIVVEALGLEFTEEAYHERVRGQIERDGYTTICVNHLGTLALTARYLSVNSARQNLVYVEECAAEAARMEQNNDLLVP